MTTAQKYAECEFEGRVRAKYDELRHSIVDGKETRAPWATDECLMEFAVIHVKLEMESIACLKK